MISNEVVLNKMMRELQAASQSADDHTVMLEHISNIRLLTELFLEENSEKEIQPKELKVRPVTKKSSQVLEKVNVTPMIDNKDGTSIFDF